jgi:hypothetical protein
MERQRHRAFVITAAIAALAVVGGAHRAGAEQGIDLDGLTLRQAAAELCAGKITSKALTSAALARAKATGNLNAFITLDEAGAMKAASAFSMPPTSEGLRANLLAAFPS